MEFTSPIFHLNCKVKSVWKSTTSHNLLLKYRKIFCSHKWVHVLEDYSGILVKKQREWTMDKEGFDKTLPMLLQLLCLQRL